MTLRARVAVGLGWTGAAHWLGLVIATATTAVVARFLAPADYAVIAAAGALAGVMGVLQESGIAAAVVRHAGDEDRAATTGLVLNLVAATVTLLACLALTPRFAAFFRIDDAGALAVAFVPLWLRAWTNVPLARLQKALDFRRCALVEGVQMLCYPALTVPLAVHGAGAWALVLGQAGAAAAGTVAVWVLSPWRPRLRHLDWSTGRELMRYGRPLVWSNLLGMVNDRVDNVVTGRVLGPAALGLYAMSFRLAALPRSAFTFVVSRVLFPAMATLQGDERRVGEAFLRALHWVAVLAFPATVGLVVVAPELVTVVLGPRWVEVVTPLRVLAGFALLGALAATTGDVFKATGRPGLIFRVGLVHSAVLWTGLLLLAPRGIAAVALAVSLATLASTTVAFACVLRALRLGPVALTRALAAPVVATLVMVVALFGVRELPLAADATRLIALVGAGAVVYAAALALVAPADLRELADVLSAVRAGRAPRGRALARG